MASSSIVNNGVDWIEMHGPEKPPPTMGIPLKAPKAEMAWASWVWPQWVPVW